MPRGTEPMMNMDLSEGTIISALERVFSDDATHRKDAEFFFSQAETQAGYFPFILDLTVKPQVAQEIRQAASIQLKNAVKNRWEARQDRPSIAPKDKQYIRECILPAVSRCTVNTVRTQLEECLRVVVLHDYPDNSQQIRMQIEQSLLEASNSTTKEENEIKKNNLYASLVAIRKITRKFEMKKTDQREPVEELALNIFPMILSVGNSLLLLLENTTPTIDLVEDACVLLKLMIKSYWSATQMSLCKTLQNSEYFDAWMNILLRCVALPISVNVSMPDDNDDRSKLNFFKLKRWSIQVAHRFGARYGNPSLACSDDEKAFAEIYMKRWAPEFLRVTMVHLTTYTREMMTGATPTGTTKRLTNLYIQLLNNALQHATLYKQLREGMISFDTSGTCVLFELCFRLLSFSDDDFIKWREDPSDFVRAELDVCDFVDPRVAASDLIKNAVKLRGKNILGQLVRKVENILVQTQNCQYMTIVE
eukprot:GHVR01105097.1.p1 GENE.GHVR01105097.1~~GHVR01105097.1.p1  ORF type:complete len:478 (+),score=119.55 GHVR01105097.1:54-1487(+)